MKTILSRLNKSIIVLTKSKKTKIKRKGVNGKEDSHDQDPEISRRVPEEDQKQSQGLEKKRRPDTRNINGQGEKANGLISLKIYR